MHRVFISGGTGYVGRALVEQLIARGHDVRVLARTESTAKVPMGATPILGNALDPATFAEQLADSDTFVHLTGVARPSPWKAHAFRTIDLASLRASTQAARQSAIRHFIYISVAQPAPVMKAYIRVRQECEGIIAGLKIGATILRPWYILGPGHRWPIVMQPIYALMERIPATRDGARRLGFVTQAQMIDALAWAVEHPIEGTRIMDVPAIRAQAMASAAIARPASAAPR